MMVRIEAAASALTPQTGGIVHALANACPDAGLVGRMRTAPARIHLLVADDHDVVRWGFRLLLADQPWVASCDLASNAEQAVAAIRRTAPDVAIVDLLVGTDSGTELCRQIRAVSPGTRVLMISGSGALSEPTARAAGAAGFVSKDWRGPDVLALTPRTSLMPPL